MQGLPGDPSLGQSPDMVGGGIPCGPIRDASSRPGRPTTAAQPRGCGGAPPAPTSLSTPPDNNCLRLQNKTATTPLPAPLSPHPYLSLGTLVHSWMPVPLYLSGCPCSSVAKGQPRIELFPSLACPFPFFYSNDGGFLACCGF